MKVVDWVKNNKLASLVIVILLFLLLKNNFNIIKPLSISRNLSAPIPKVINYGGVSSEGMMDTAYKAPSSLGGIRVNEAAPAPEVTQRMVVETSNLSLVVDNVRQKLDTILDYINQKQGYMVSSSLNQPEEAPFATLTVRVPSKELRPTLDYLRGLAIKVTSENLTGYDVTDQYVDMEARLSTLNLTKAKFEEILNKASTVDQIMQVQQQIIYIQSQIDSLKGQQKYLEKTAENAKLTIYLSTDEFALPYAPQTPSFRPSVIFKMAVRSLVQTSRGLAEKAIWIGVFTPIWLPIVLIYFWWKRRKTS